jgi:hypothetical protein
VNALKVAAAWILVAILLMPANLVGVTVHDEGFIATGAMIILRGGLPYRDFVTFYGPAQYYATASLFAILGENLLVLRLLHIAWIATLVLVVWFVTRRLSSGRLSAFLASIATLGIALYALPSVGYPAIPATLLLLSAALPLSDWAIGTSRRGLVVASTLVGLAALVRWDFGVFGLVSLSLTTTIAVCARKASICEWGRSVLFAIAPALVIAAVCYLPLLAIASQAGRSYREVIEYSIYEFPKWRRLEYLRPAYWTLLEATDAHQGTRAFEALARIAYLLVPISLLPIGLAILLLPSRYRTRRCPRSWTIALYATLLSLLLLQQMRVRPTLWQGFGAVVAFIPVMVYTTGFVSALVTRQRRALWAVRAPGAIMLAAILLAALLNLRAVLGGDLVSLALDRASLIRVKRSDASYGELVRYVRNRTSSTDLLYSGATDHSTLVVNDSLIYFLANRIPADRFVELDPGLANTPRAQGEIADALRASGVPMIVLLALNPREPNQSSSSNGVFLLDEFIRSRYAEPISFGPYTVLHRAREAP